MELNCRHVWSGTRHKVASTVNGLTGGAKENRMTDFISQMILLLAVFMCGFLIGDKRE